MKGLGHIFNKINPPSKRIKYLLFLSGILPVILLTNYAHADISYSRDNVLAEGKSLLSDGNYSGALSMFGLVLSNNPHDLDATYQEGITLYDMGDYFIAIPLFDTVLQQEPKDLNALYYKGLTLQGLGNYTGEIQVYEKLFEIDPRNTTALDSEGFAQGNLANYTAVLEVSKKALKIDPKDVIALTNEGVSYERLDKYNFSQVAYNEALAIDPNHEPALFNYGYLFDLEGNTTGAIRLYDEVLRIDPNSTKALDNEGLDLIITGDNKKAKDLADRALLNNSADADAWYIKYSALENMGEPEVAAQTYNKFISTNTTNIDFLKLAAGEQRNHERYQEEIVILDRLVTIPLQPSDVEWAKMQRGEAEMKLGDYENASYDFNDVLLDDRNNSEALDNEGIVLTKLGQYQNATLVFDRANQLSNNTDFQALSGEGFALFNLGKYEDAIQEYDNAFNLGPSEQDSLILAERKAEAIDKLNDTERLAQAGNLLVQDYKTSYSNLDLEQARIYYDHFLRSNPANSTVLEEEADIWNKLGKPLLVIPIAQEILKNQRDDVLALRLMGDAYFQLTKYDEAVRYYDLALDIDPFNILALVGKGNALDYKGTYDQALVEYTKVRDLAIQSDDPDERQQAYYASAGIVDAYSNKYQFDMANKEFNWLFTRITQDNIPLVQYANLTRGNYFYYLNDPKDAVKYYYNAIIENTYNPYPDALNGEGVSLFELGNYTGSLTYLDWAIGNNTDSDLYLANKAELLNKMGNFTLAYSIANQALAINPNNTNALTSQGDALFEMKSYSEAVRSYDKALQIEPDTVGALVGKANALLYIPNQEEEALSILNQANDTLTLEAKVSSNHLSYDDSTYKESLSHLYALAYIKIGKENLLDKKSYDYAHDYFLNALSIEPNNYEAKQGLSDAVNEKRWDQVGRWGLVAGIVGSGAAVIPFIHRHKKRKQRMKNQNKNEKGVL